MRLNILLSMHIKNITRSLCFKKSHVVYLIFVILSAGLSVAKYGVFADILGIEDFGTYSLVLTNYVFVIYVASFGTNEAVLKLGGTAFGRGNEFEIANIRNKGLFYGLVSMIFISCFFAFILFFILQEKIFEIVVFSILLAVSALTFNVLESYFRAKQKAVIFSSMLLAKSSLLLAGGAWLGKEFGLSGILFCEVVSFFVVFIIYFSFSDKGGFPRLKFFLSDLKEIIKNGLHLLSSMFFRLLALMIDRWAVAYTLGMSSVGKYAFIMILHQIGIMGLGLITNIMGPKWLANYACDYDRRGVLEGVNKVAKFILTLTIVCAFPVVYFISKFVELYFSEYYGYQFLEMVICVYVGVAVLCISQLYDWFFIVISREDMLNKLSGMNLFLSVVSVFIISTIGPSLIGYFTAFVLVRVVLGVLYFLAVNKCSVKL
jgi:O-antigen/teichoic acid export membrane protein